MLASLPPYPILAMDLPWMVYDVPSVSGIRTRPLGRWLSCFSSNYPPPSRTTLCTFTHSPKSNLCTSSTTTTHGQHGLQHNHSYTHASCVLPYHRQRGARHRPTYIRAYFDFRGSPWTDWRNTNLTIMGRTPNLDGSFSLATITSMHRNSSPSCSFSLPDMVSFTPLNASLASWYVESSYSALLVLTGICLEYVCHSSNNREPDYGQSYGTYHCH